jgi:hypothetical protein
LAILTASAGSSEGSAQVHGNTSEIPEVALFRPYSS